MQTRVIAIVGAGFSGSMVAVHLLRQATAPLTIQLIERRSAQGALGRGVAYSTQADCHLLNVPTGKMSAFSDDPTHFLRWSRQQGLTEISAETFAPRRLYGDYLRSTLADAVQQAAQGVKLECLEDEAIAIHPDGDRAIVCLRSGDNLSVDRVVLALGNLPPKPPAVTDPTFYQSRRYVRSAWVAPELHLLPADASVLLIGSGLTAIDTILTLRQQGHRGQIQLVSRRGLLPQSHRAHQTRQIPIAFDRLSLDETPKTVRSLLRQVRQTIDLTIAQGGDWRSVMDAMRPQTQALWQQLSPAEQRRFLRHLRPYWDVHRHRLAPAIAQTIDRLRQSGQLQLTAGRIQAYHEDAAGVDVLIRPRGEQALIRLRSHLVVNCTGSECDYRKVAQPLIQLLLATGLSRCDRLNLGLETDATGALITASGETSACLYTLGSARKGRLWETTAVPELREQASQLAQRLCQFRFTEASTAARATEQDFSGSAIALIGATKS
jgi:uncharacterized NAD(P)/FAD-binding protein YdhS